jgi:SAM-dependent methyltransferase
VLDDHVPWLGLTPLRQERIDACLPYVKGRLLDVGCGENLLVKAHGNGVGVDIFPWPGVNVLCDTRRLPFQDGSFDSAALIACLNHIPDREQVLNEVHRALKPNGRLIVTMIDPVVGYFAHKVTHVLNTDPDGCERERKDGEHWGLWGERVRELLKNAGFVIRRHRRFVYGMNQLFIAEKVG